MYTQCPECQTAFRVTATVLQQAAGRVRCGGCGNAFSAIDHLSEELPTPQKPAAAAPEAHDDLPTDDEFAQTSKQLLQTLEELAGPEDVRIEDTGVEWRVLDKDKSGDAAGSESSDTGSVRWYLEEGEGNLPEISDEVTEEDRAAATSVDEMRFDDNTPLPEDFGAGDADGEPAPPMRRASDIAAQEAANYDEKQADLALGEPEEWGDLLDEVGEEKVQGEEIPLEVEEELAAIHSELSTKPAAAEESAAPEAGPEIPSDIDTQFDIQAEAMGLDTTGSREIVEEAEAAEPADDEVHEEESTVGEAGGADEEQAPDAEESDEALAVALDSTDEFQAQIEDVAAALAKDEGFEQYAAPEPETPDLELEEQPAGPREYYEQGKDEPDEDAEREPVGDLPADDADIDDEEDAEPGVEVPDAEIVAQEDVAAEVATGDDDTEIGESDDKVATTLAGIADPSELFDENSGEVETIIMEGEFVRGSLEKERHEKERRAAANLREGKNLADTYALNRGMVKGGRRSTDPAGTAVIVGIVVLALLLIGQFVHASRESLATNALFNNTIAPIYRMLGMPITPQWDIKGWQFEVTNGSTDEAEEVLTISSRITNRSEQPLPYPLVHVSLADRYEEIIGSRVLEPNEYLAGDLDPSRPVAPDDNFTAVITIGDLPAEATGFKLNVCYRVATGQMRCATEDFKN